MIEEEYSSQTVHGSVINSLTRNIASRLYPFNGFSHLLERPICRVGVEREDGGVHGGIHIQNAFQKNSNTHWAATMGRYLAIPNGQVKNFLVAVRTYGGGLFKKLNRPVKIVVIGSKGGQGSGIWHMTYAALLSTVDKKIVIDMFDDREIPDKFTWEEGDSSIVINYYARQYHGGGKGYDVLVDDAFVPKKGVVRIKPSCPIFSLKGDHNDWQDPDFVPFLHPTEVRHFSSLPSSLTVDCRCIVCSACAASVDSYESYRTLRIACSKIGHSHDCLALGSLHSELFYLGSVLRLIVTSPIFALYKPRDYRSVLALQEELPLSFQGPHSVSYSPGIREERLLVHGEGFLAPVVSSAICERLAGKSVSFIGVEPSVLEATPILTSGTFAHKGVPEVVFFGSINAAAITPSAPIMYIRKNELEVKSSLSEFWTATGHRWKDFFEYEFHGPPSLRDVGYSYMKEGSFVRTSSIALFPCVVDETSHPPLVTLRPCPVSKSSSTLLLSTLVVTSTMVKVLPFDKMSSPLLTIWRDSSGNYGTISPSSYSMSIRSRLSSEFLIPSHPYFIPSCWTKTQRFQFERDNHSILEILRSNVTVYESYFPENLRPSFRKIIKEVEVWRNVSTMPSGKGFYWGRILKSCPVLRGLTSDSGD